MAQRFLQRLNATLVAGINLLIPAVCTSCHYKLNCEQSLLCEDCLAKIKLIEDNICPKCGSALEAGVCLACRQEDFDFDLARAVFCYEEPLSSLVHNLKYRGHTGGAKFLAVAMAAYIQAQPCYQNCDYLVAVPLHPVRKRERGYNQSELIARKVASLTGIKYLKAVQRTRYTASQTLLHRNERLQNLKAAFRATNKAALSGKSLILLDDVFTTGTTLNEISKTLHAAGATTVLGLTACRA